MLLHDHRSDDTTDGRSIVRNVAGRLLGVGPDEITIASGPGGKPRLVAPASASLRFNLSDADGRIAAAFADGYEVGVDIERADRTTVEPRRFARRVLHAHEMATIHDLDDPEFDRALMRYWTRKEAVLKATGRGLHRALDEIDTEPELIELDDRLWRCRTLAHADLVLSIAWGQAGTR